MEYKFIDSTPCCYIILIYLGLGTIISFQLTALLRLAASRNAVLLISNSDLNSPYFEACVPGHIHHKRFECLFQPISSCTEQSVEKVSKVIHTTAMANDHERMVWTDWILLTAFVSRPSNFALSLVEESLPGYNFMRKGIGVHIRQGRSQDSPDFVRRQSHLWTNSEVITFMTEVMQASNKNSFVLISDDALLAASISDSFKSKETVHVLVPTMHHYPRLDSTNDCMREVSLGCNQTMSRADIARAVVVDLIAASRNEMFAVCFNSAYAWLLLGMAASYNGKIAGTENLFDLDQPNCSTSHGVANVRCQFTHAARLHGFSHPSQSVKR